MNSFEPQKAEVRMNEDQEPRITIIGLGSLMEEVFPCISATVGVENLHAKVNAVTADQVDCQGKEDRLGIRVILNDNLAALKAMHPDIIFFAPPPDVALGLIENELKTYIDECRTSGAIIPDIYAFPPVPDGEVYHRILGSEVPVVRILPNGIKSIAGVPLNNPSIAAFEGTWPEEHQERARRIWSHKGGLLELAPHQLLGVLSGGIMAHVSTDLVLQTTDTLAELGMSVFYDDLASYLRARHQITTGVSRAESCVASLDAISGPLCLVLDDLILGWYQGIVDCLDKTDLPEGLGAFMMATMLDTMLWLAQAEPREVIERHTALAATPGGVLEKGLLIYRESIAPFIWQALYNLPELPQPGWQADIRGQVFQAALRVWEHGKALAGKV